MGGLKQNQELLLRTTMAYGLLWLSSPRPRISVGGLFQESSPVRKWSIWPPKWFSPVASESKS